jgi:hypothetical protein
MRRPGSRRAEDSQTHVDDVRSHVGSADVAVLLDDPARDAATVACRWHQSHQLVVPGRWGKHRPTTAACPRDGVTTSSFVTSAGQTDSCPT